MSSTEHEDHSRGGSALSDGLGPWCPHYSSPYSGGQKRWVLRRRNAKWWGGYQTMLTANQKERRFASEAAAQKAAAAANGPNVPVNLTTRAADDL